MTSNGIGARNRAAQAVSAVTLTLGLVFSLVLFPVVSSASGTYQAQGVPTSTTIAAGGTATLTVRGFCLDFGKPFPTGAMTGKGLADANIRSALNYAIQKGYTSGNAQQVEQAIWNLRDNTWHNQSHEIGTEIVTNATAANAPATSTDGVSVVDALTKGQVTVSATFVPQTPDAFYGDGKVTIKNTGTSDLRIYMPVGVVFTAGNNGTFQDLVAYQLAPEALQATGTTTVSSTGTASPATTGTVSGTATAGTTATSATTATTGTTATAETTGTAGTTATAVTTAVATSTTVVETSTPEATATTGTVEATATTVPGSSTLPQTGSGSSNPLPIVVLMMGIMMTVIGSTALIASKRRS